MCLWSLRKVNPTHLIELPFIISELLSMKYTNSVDS